MLRALWKLIFPNPAIHIYPEDMRALLAYQARINRCTHPPVDSSADPARECILLHDAAVQGNLTLKNVQYGPRS